MFRSSLGFSVGKGLRFLLLANLAIFAFFFFANKIFPLYSEVALNLLSLSPYSLGHKFYIWQGFTYLFLHDGEIHLLFNLLMLWMFGMELEQRWGTRSFLKFFLTCGFLAGVTWALFFIDDPSVRLIGASGAVYAVMLAYALTFPHRIVLFMFFIPMRTITMIVLIALLDLFAGLSSASMGGSRIAHFVHLLGMLYAYIYVRWGWKIEETIAPLKKLFSGILRVQKKHKIKVHIQKNEPAATPRSPTLSHTEIEHKVDEILEKINKQGYSSLSNEEREFLDYASNLYSEKE